MTRLEPAGCDGPSRVPPGAEAERYLVAEAGGHRQRALPALLVAATSP